MIISTKDKPQKIVSANPMRTYLAIHNTHATGILYISPNELTSDNDYEDASGYPVSTTTPFKIEGVDCYKGSIYGAADTDTVDVRVLEL